MNWCVYDPKPYANQYFSEVYLLGIRQFCTKHGRSLCDISDFNDVTNKVVLILAERLTSDVIDCLKNNGNKIVAFSVSDSSYISQCCRAGGQMQKIDLIFAATGLQKVNSGQELIIDKEFNIQLEKRQFLPEEDWAVFNSMRQSGRLQSLPYVHWTPLPEVTPKPYSARSQKVIIRGGNHMKRFILALLLSKLDLLDVNSGFITEQYFSDDMHHQYRYCDNCREVWKQNRRYPYDTTAISRCNCPTQPFDNLGKWNNVSPALFYRYSQNIGHRYGPFDPIVLENLMNGEWLPAKRHQELLSRITFTSDYKWAFSIFAPQRFWDGAAVGCINLLPKRTADQDYFPAMQENVHYKTFTEDCSKLAEEAVVSESEYNEIAGNALHIYNGYMKPDEYSIGTPILQHIFTQIERFTT